MVTRDFFFFSSRRRHTRYWRDWSSDVCSSDLIGLTGVFSLAGWARRIRAGLLVSRVTQDTAMSSLASRTGLSPSMMGRSRALPFTIDVQQRGPTTPAEIGRAHV